MKILDGTLKGFLCFFIAIFIISFAIAFVILFRPYYYLNIGWLQLEQKTGYTYSEITEAYDDVMDYLVFGDEFKTGSLKYSEEGKSHFEDCKKLFTLDFICLFLSSAYIITIMVLQKYKKIELKFKKFSPGIYSIIGTGTVFLILGIWGCIDFDSLFTAFHKVCFPGKDNWIFNWNEDQIIRILPTELWINFCILIVAIILIFIGVIIFLEIRRRKRIKNENELITE